MARTERQEFLARLAVYLIGIAVGCVILGFFAQARQFEAQRRAAQAQADAAVAAAASHPVTPNTQVGQPAPGGSTPAK